jgi:hypothetical protein
LCTNDTNSPDARGPPSVQARTGRSVSGIVAHAGGCHVNVITFRPGCLLEVGQSVADNAQYCSAIDGSARACRVSVPEVEVHEGPHG